MDDRFSRDNLEATHRKWDEAGVTPYVSPEECPTCRIILGLDPSRYVHRPGSTS